LRVRPQKPKPVGGIEPPPAPAQKAAEGDTGVFGWFGAGGGSSSLRPEDRKGVAVNAYLWRASLDTLSFMPMDQIDPFGGVIKSGWWVPPATPNERIRVRRDPRHAPEGRSAPGNRVQGNQEAHRRVGSYGRPDPETVTKLENIILNKARAMKIQLRVARPRFIWCRARPDAASLIAGEGW
jgi:hypothetical protein